ncbi:hypothetical protein N8152_01135 [bacterium]|jgi:hypothetical protein|nr:hypothetical protein [bacterium]|tara:strand:- start:21014 stop:21295 length:282 start_codon:yes stop_codon:yes gene_type:complete
MVRDALARVVPITWPELETGFVVDACHVRNLNVFLPVSTIKKYFPLTDTEALGELSEVFFFIDVAPAETHASEAAFFKPIEHTNRSHEAKNQA